MYMFFLNVYFLYRSPVCLRFLFFSCKKKCPFCVVPPGMYDKQTKTTSCGPGVEERIVQLALRHWASYVTFRIESQRPRGCCISYFAQYPEFGLGLCVIHTRTGFIRVCQGSSTTTQRFQDSRGCSGQEKLSILQDLLHSWIASEHLCRCTPSRRVITRSKKNTVKQCATFTPLFHVQDVVQFCSGSSIRTIGIL